MNIEKEYKYVLNKNMIGDIINSIDTHGCITMQIEQHYFNDSTRVRQIINNVGVASCFFTMKLPLPDGNGFYEFEKHIDKAEFDAMKALASTHVYKIRKAFHYGNHKWEVDFFYNEQDKIILILIEVEVKEHEGRPSDFPVFLKDYIIQDVTFGDKTYSNYYIPQNFN